MSRPRFPHKCPNCGEEGSIDVDTVEAEAYCAECGLVVRRGLEEDSQTRYYGNEGLSEYKAYDDEGGDETEQSKRAVGNKSINVLPGQTRTRGSVDMPPDLTFLRPVLGKDNEALEQATTKLFRQVLVALKNREGSINLGSKDSARALAAACLLYAAARRRAPISQEEFFGRMEPRIGADAVKTLRPLIQQKHAHLCDLLGLRAEALSLEQYAIEDLARVYLTRLHWAHNIFFPSVVVMATELNPCLSRHNMSEQFSPARCVAAALYLARMSKKLNPQLVELAEAPRDVGITIAKTLFIGPANFEAVLSVLKRCKEARLELLKKGEVASVGSAAAGSTTTSSQPSAQKRLREE